MWFVYLLIVLLGIALLLLSAVLPGRRRDNVPFCHTRFAHRGLHSNDSAVPENSLAAFRRAREYGYGVELDVQFTADRQIVVFHDNTLTRICGVDRRVDEMTYAELQSLQLLGSDQYIPLLDEVLEVLVDVPLLCEFKPMRSYTDTTLCEAALSHLQQYKGPWCVESFNPFMMRWFRKNAPEVRRGILSKRFEKGEVEPALRSPLSALMANFLCRPDFIAYQHTDHSQPFFRFCRLFRPTTMAWTIRTQQEEDRAKVRFDTIIFEGYLPEKR